MSTSFCIECGTLLPNENFWHCDAKIQMWADDKVTEGSWIHENVATRDGIAYGRTHYKRFKYLPYNWIAV
jgi:hypothetical protein